MRAQVLSIVGLVWLLGSGLLPGCAMKPETPSRWPDASAQVLAEPGAGREVVRVAVDPTLAAVAGDLEPMYEGVRPGVDLVLHEGVRTQRLDRAAWLAMRLERGAEADAYLSESVHQIRELTRRPQGSEAWLGNTLAVITAHDSPLDAGALLGRSVPVHIALERSALGTWTRASLREAGLWGEVSLGAGNFDGGEPIVERVAYFARRRPAEQSLGVVFGSDVDVQRVKIVGYLDQPRGDATIHHVAWFSDAGADFANWLLSDEQARAAASRAGFVVRPPGGALR